MVVCVALANKDQRRADGAGEARACLLGGLLRSLTRSVRQSGESLQRGRSPASPRSRVSEEQLRPAPGPG